ncbi:HAMP domain-containing histidine kinase [Rossellomorea aquimaris]|uniref:HAMP domain-containing sensor histidine kinase n=1 Tax=Rossellomorea aquimaris TaxID=189382 RepID=UPI001CD5FF5E|nr:HAMP domain-containing sensor histidine kinase [Rossellomorea aquimaris]MCA1060637.1 HAMP domain-containing histidine kinase [Rossellomorea aquimaris]
MRTLYIRIVVVTLLIMIVSSVIAFIGSNLYYQMILKPSNDEKNTEIAHDVVELFEAASIDESTFFKKTAKLSYQFYVTDGKAGTFYGEEFRNRTLSPEVITSVLNGTTYHGMAEYPSTTFVTGFFSNELSNSIGVPIEIDGKPHALFMRPNVKQQFNEIHILLSVLLLLTIALSMLIVFFSTRYLVKPIRELTVATKKIAGGDYSIQLKENRNDEIGTLAKSFTSMSRQLRQVDQMRQEFVSNVSHEIQTPLSSMKGYANLLRSPSISKEDQDYYSKVIETESTRLSTLSKQLLTLASLDKDQAVLKHEPVNLTKMLQDLIAQTRWLWEEKNLALSLEADEVIYSGHEDLLHQAFENLLSNSIKYTHRDGEIHMSLHKEQEGVTFKIQDTGIGIPSTHLEKIFDRFYKVDESRSHERDSSGLGLSIVKKIITLHHGEIHVKSIPHKGTTFTVTLP